MTEQNITKLKSRIKSLQQQLADKSQILQKYQTMGNAAEEKIQALSKIHNDKIRSLMNSIQVLKKQNATLQNQGKQHKRSKLISQLNKQIQDQDIVIQVLRNYIYKKQGKQNGRNICDNMIVTALTKGPQRIRILSRQQLKIQIEKLKNQILLIKSGNAKGNEGLTLNKNLIQKQNNVKLTERSQQSHESSFDNTNQQLFKQLQNFKFQNESLKLELKSQQKIIENLGHELRENGKIQVELLTVKGELQVSQKKLETLQTLLKQTKEHSNTKIIQLYQRQIKVQQLELQSKQYANKLNSLNQNHNLQIQQLKLEKQKLIAELDSLTKENQRLILENTSLKKRQQQQKNKMLEIRQLHTKQKDQLTAKLTKYEKQIERIMQQNQNRAEKIMTLQKTAREDKAHFIEEKMALINQIQNLKEEIRNGVKKQQYQNIKSKSLQMQIQIKKMKQIIQSGNLQTNSSLPNDHLLQRLKGYQNKIQLLEQKLRGQGKITQQQLQSLGDKQWFNKYVQLAREFQVYKIKSKVTPNQQQKKIEITKKKKPVQRIEIYKEQKERLQNLSSDLSELGLKSVDQRILNNYDSSFEYSLHTIDKLKNGVPTINQNDKQLLNLINSDLWQFINQDKIGHLIDQLASNYNSDYEQFGLKTQSNYSDFQWQKNFKQLEQLQNKMKNGQQIKIYKQQTKAIKNMSQSVSQITQKNKDNLSEIDSQFNLKIGKLDINRIDDPTKKPLGLKKQELAKIDNISSSISPSIANISVSDAKSGQSGINILGKKKMSKDRGTRLQSKLKDADSDYESVRSIKQKIEDINSDVSLSDYINQSDLKSMDSNISNFKKKK